MTEKRPSGLFPTKLVAIAAVAGIVAGAAAVYVRETTSGNAVETADAAQCEGSVARAEALTPYLKGDVAAMIPVSEPKLIQGLTFQDKAGAPMTMANFANKTVLINLWATWCVPCRDEHPLLEVLKAESGVRLYGINQRDQADNAVKFLTELGNPYDAIGADADGRVSIDWGVYGVPETFVVNPAGTITYKHVGPIDAQSLPEVIAAVESARLSQ